MDEIEPFSEDNRNRVLDPVQLQLPPPGTIIDTSVVEERELNMQGVQFENTLQVVETPLVEEEELVLLAVQVRFGI